MKGKKDSKQIMAGEIAEELFALVEHDQGGAFISDGMELMDRELFLDCVESSLECTLRTVKAFRSFLKKYGRSGKPQSLSAFFKKHGSARKPQ